MLKTKAATAVLAAVLCSSAAAQSAVLHGPSHHTSAGFNNNNYGLGYKSADNFVVGVFRNSENKNSAYAAHEFKLSTWGSVVVGAATGYKAAAVMPVIMPTVTVSFGELGLVFGAMPYYSLTEKKWGVVVHTMLEFKL